jgi:acetyl-CoA carboxylase carboxyltransferase component
MAFEKEVDELAERRAKAGGMGSEARLAAWAEAGILNARQRLDLLLDDGSFAEVGLLAVSDRPEDRARTPGDGVVDGYGRIDGRPVVVHAADFTTMGASSAAVMMRKMDHCRRVAAENGMPLVMLGECSGARIPDIMGARGIHRAGELSTFSRMREVPWVSAVLGQSYGGSTWLASLSDFVVMRKGAVMAVSSERVTSVAVSETVDDEALGGWDMQTAITGQVDLAVERDADALEALRRFLAYLPSHNMEPPPPAAVPSGSGAGSGRILDLVPESRAKVYDVRAVIACIVDAESFFPLKERFAKPAVTGLARLQGRSIGVIATNPMFKGGALDPDACDKITSFIVLCDSFNIPLVILADTPGFLVGVEGERRKLPGKIMNYMQALELATVPKLSVIMRKSYGQAHLNMGGGKCDEMAAWFTADVSFMDPNVAVNVVYGLKYEDDPERYSELAAELSCNTSGYDLAAGFQAQTVIDPRETRDWLARMLEVHQRRPTGGVGEHHLRTWPTVY